MIYQAYIDYIRARTGKTPDGFRKRAEQKDFVAGGKIKPDVKAGAIVDWL